MKRDHSNTLKPDQSSAPCADCARHANYIVLECDLSSVRPTRQKLKLKRRLRNFTQGGSMHA